METLASSHTEEEALRSSKPHSVSPFLRFLFCDVVFGIRRKLGHKGRVLQNGEPSPDHFLTMSPPPTKRQICQIRPPYSQTAGLRFHLQRYRFITSTTAAATTAPSSTIAPPTPSVSLRSHFRLRLGPLLPRDGWIPVVDGFFLPNNVPEIVGKQNDWFVSIMSGPMTLSFRVNVCLLRHIAKQLSSLPPQQQLSSSSWDETSGCACFCIRAEKK